MIPTREAGFVMIAGCADAARPRARERGYDPESFGPVMAPDFGTKLLLVLHATSAIVLVGAATHNGLLAIRQLGGNPVRRALQRLYVRIVGWAYLATFALGLATYPAFRLDVRAAWLDEHLPVATRMFEIKEHWLALGLVILAGYWPMSRTIDIARRSADSRLYHFCGIALAVIVLMATFTGLSLVAIRPVGG
jgi:hypothetical protein